jgi:hypothetical protein
MNVTATDAKTRFGALGLEAREEPIVVEKAGPTRCCCPGLKTSA